jgi:hypothetical protein
LARSAHRGRAADVLAQCQCQRRGNLVVGPGLDDFAQRHDFTFLVGDLQAHDRLARNHFHDAHTDGRERTRKILGEAGDLAHLDARCGTHFEAGHHRTRQHRDHLDLDTEILELELHEARHGLERFLRVGRFARRRIVEHLQRGQRSGLGGVEQRHLALFLHALALLHHRGGSLDARFGARRGFLLLDLGGLDPRLLGFESHGHVACHAAPRTHPADRIQMPAPIRSTMVSHDTPNDSETPAIQAASINSVAPRKFMLAASPLPMNCPTTPPAVWRKLPALQCNVASPQLANSISVNPPMRTALLARVRPSSCSRWRNMKKHAAAITSGNR